MDKKFKNLFKIGERAVALLQNEVFINDIANAGLINDLVTAYAELIVAVDATGLTAPEKDALKQPFRDVLDRYNFVDIVVIEPDKLYSKSLEFDPVKIQEAIQGGIDKVNDMWTADIEPVVTV